MVCTLIVGMALLAAEPPAPPRPVPAGPEAADTAARAEYDARRAEAPDTADGPLEAGPLVRAEGAGGRGPRSSS